MNEKNKNMCRNQQIKSYLQQQPKPTIAFSELNQTQPAKTKYWPWILGGIGVLGLVGVIIYFLTRLGKERATVPFIRRINNG